MPFHNIAAHRYRFELWQNAHKSGLPKIGSSESSSMQYGASGRRFKHTKMRAPKAPDRYRDDYHVKNKKAMEAAAAAKEAGQLRTADQIRKLRTLKEKKKQKNETKWK